MIGEIAFFLHMPRSASIIAATEDVRFYVTDCILSCFLRVVFI
jgi:CRP-like cAMP-binding protein